MSDTSPILGLPYIQPSQAQKHVTHNEAIRALDALVQLTVSDRDRTEPPVAPASGDRHIVADGATGLWLDKDGDIAVYEDAGWTFYSPNEGWQAVVRAENAVVIRSGAMWSAPSVVTEALQNLPTLGINTTADTTNRLSISAGATLFNHEGADHRVVVNKADDANTASLLFQSNWTGHAEMGLTGGQDFSVRVSPDGATFVDALRADAASGIVTAPQGVSFGATTLNQYEEGIFTPTLTFGGDDAGITYSQQAGSFTRVGNLVVLQIAIDLSAIGTGIGVAEINDLPFEIGLASYPGELSFIGGGAGLTAPKCSTLTGRKIRLQNSGPSGIADLTNVNFTSAASLKITVLHTV